MSDYNLTRTGVTDPVSVSITERNSDTNVLTEAEARQLATRMEETATALSTGGTTVSASDFTATVGSETFTYAQLHGDTADARIVANATAGGTVDVTPPVVTPPVVTDPVVTDPVVTDPDPTPTSIDGLRLRHGIRLDGFGTSSFMSGGGATARYQLELSNPSFPYLAGEFGAGFGTFSLSGDGTTPGGETYNSALNPHFNFVLSAGARAYPFAGVNSFVRNLGIGAGLQWMIGGINSPGNCTETSPGGSVDDVGHEGSASGGTTYNTGLCGLTNPAIGNSIDAEGGITHALGIPFSLSLDIPAGDHAVQLFAGVMPGWRWNNPSVRGGSNSNQFEITGFGGVTWYFGSSGAASSTAHSSPQVAHVAANATPTTPDRVDGGTTTVAPGAEGSFTAPDGGWKPGSTVRVNGRDTNIRPTGTNPLTIDEGLLTEDRNTVEVRDASGTVYWTAIIEINRSAAPQNPQTWEPNNLSVTDEAVRDAATDDTVVGRIGRVVARTEIAAGSQLQVKTGNGRVIATIAVPNAIAVGGSLDVNLTKAQITALGLTAGNSANVFVTLGSLNLGNVTVAMTPAAPAHATLTAASVTSTSSYYRNDTIRIRVTSDIAGPARITVGGHTEDVTLTAGVNNIAMSGAPKTWNTGARAGRRSNQTIVIQPLSGTTLAGASVNVGSVSISRAGGRRRTTTTGGPPPLR